MKRLGIIVAVLLAAGAVSSWAQELDQFLFNVPITLKGKLSDKTAVTDATLNQGSLTFAEVLLINVGSPTDTIYVIGTSLVLTNEVSGSVTNVKVNGTLVWDSMNNVVTSKPGAKATTVVMAMTEPNGGVLDLTTDTSVSNAYAVISNSVLIAEVTVSASGKSTNVNTVSGKFEGIWFDGSTAVSGSFKSEKASK
jgi:hypothetical protein